MWEQVKRFDIKKMGTKKGYCLQNVRLGFGIAPKYASAKLDMEANRRAGTLHGMSSIPNNVSVPVYMDTSSKYEHIIVCHNGNYYSDGKRLTSIRGIKFFGLCETCNGVRVVKEIKGAGYTTGTYRVNASLLKVRADAGISNRAKNWNELTPNARQQNKKLGNEKANGYLNGVVCTVTNVSGNWGLTKSGWICLDYCKKI